MTLDIALILTVIVVLLLLSALFNASETALTAVSRARMHALEQEGNARARLVNQLLREPERLIGVVLLGNTLVDILAASLASGLAVILIGPAGVAYATAVMTILIVIFAAVLPKTYAFAFSDRLALFVAPLVLGAGPNALEGWPAMRLGERELELSSRPVGPDTLLVADVHEV